MACLWPSRLTVADAQNGQGQSWLVGYDVDRERLQGNELHLTAKVDAFRDECICMFEMQSRLGSATAHYPGLLGLTDTLGFWWRCSLDVSSRRSRGQREAAVAAVRPG